MRWHVIITLLCPFHEYKYEEARTQANRTAFEYKVDTNEISNWPTKHKQSTNKPTFNNRGRVERNTSAAAPSTIWASTERELTLLRASEAIVKLTK